MPIVAESPKKNFLETVFGSKPLIYAAKKNIKTIETDVNLVHARLLSSQKILLKIMQLADKLGDKTKLSKYLHEIESSYKQTAWLNARAAELVKSVHGANLINDFLLQETKKNIQEFQMHRPAAQSTAAQINAKAGDEITRIEQLHAAIGEYNRNLQAVARQVNDAKALMEAMPRSNAFSSQDKKRGKVLANALYNAETNLNEALKLFHECLAELLKLKEIYQQFKRYEEEWMKKYPGSKSVLHLYK